MEFPLVVVKNGAFTPFKGSSPKELFSQYVDGVYTTARTYKKMKMISLDTHLQRLESMNTLAQNPHKSVLVRDMFMPSVRSGLVEYFNTLEKRSPGWFHSSDDEFRVSFLLSPFQGEEKPWKFDASVIRTQTELFSFSNPIKDTFYDYTAIVIVEKLRAHSLDNIKVNLVHDERKNPNIKSANWMTLRNGYEKVILENGYEESLLVNHDGCITEGISSNFFAFNANGKIETAPDNEVLKGTLRKVVLDICAQQGIEIVYRSPSTQDITQWKAAFITSTSRLALPIEDIIFDDGSFYKLSSSKYGPMAKLQQGVHEYLDVYAKDIFE